MNEEPLLPPRTLAHRPVLFVLVGAAALAAGIGLSALLLGKRSSENGDDPIEAAPAAARPKAASGSPGRDPKRPAPADDALARDLALRAEARTLAEAERTKNDREFDEVRRRSKTLHPAEAVRVLADYASRADETNRARAESEIVAAENGSRETFNRLVTEAQELARQGEYEPAAARFEALRKNAVAEVAAKCDEAAARLRTAGREADRYRASRKADEAARSIREGPAPKVLALVRARRYEEALREIDAILANPAYAPARPAIEEERAAVAAAAAFWDGFQKALRARLDQVVTLPLVDGTRVAGKLTRVLPDRAVLEAGEVSYEARFEALHLDPVVGWTLGRTLPDEPPTYLNAALFFFCEGRDDLARLYFATARELSLSFGPMERVFRTGFLRAARGPAPGPKRPK